MQPEIPRNRTSSATPPNWSLTLPSWAQPPHAAQRPARRGISLAAAAKKALRPRLRRAAPRRRS